MQMLLIVTQNHRTVLGVGEGQMSHGGYQEPEINHSVIEKNKHPLKTKVKGNYTAGMGENGTPAKSWRATEQRWYPCLAIVEK